MLVDWCSGLQIIFKLCGCVMCCVTLQLHTERRAAHRALAARTSSFSGGRSAKTSSRRAPSPRLIKESAPKLVHSLLDVRHPCQLGANWAIVRWESADCSSIQNLNNCSSLMSLS